MLWGLMSYAYAQDTSIQTLDAVNLTILNTTEDKSINLDNYKGKLIWIEFWATWCSPCIKVIPHLEKLQQRFKNELQIIMISAEKPERIKKFLKIRSPDLLFVADKEAHMSKLFPHRILPHSVLISKSGEVIGQVDPTEIDEAVIVNLLSGSVQKLNEKKDVLSDNIIEDYFSVPEHTRSKFEIQPALAGVGSRSKSYLDVPAFKNRRLTFINIGPKILYHKVYNDFSLLRIIDKTTLNKGSFCVDIIVEKEAELLPTLKQNLDEMFGFKSQITAKDTLVWRLYVKDKQKFARLKRTNTDERTYFAKLGEIDQKNISMENLAEYLEYFGDLNSPVIDETLNSEKFDIKFSFDAENPQSLIDVLNQMGLGLEQKHRAIDFLELNDA